MPSEKRKARKQNYFKAVKQSKKYAQGKVLKEDMVGFLLTCNNREREAVKEGYNLLNEFADKLFGPEKKAEDNTDEDLDCDDIDNAFDKEKKDLDEEKSKTFGERRFQQVESGANNCMFIKTTLEDPERLVHNIITDISETKIQKARFILRMIPIIGTCKAYEENIEKLAENVLSKIFKDGTEMTYSILFKTRNNNKVVRDDTIKLLGSVVKRLPGKTSVDLKSPDVSVVVEIIRTVCCLGIARNYFNQKKYNLVELAKPEELLKTEEDNGDTVKVNTEEDNRESVKVKTEEDNRGSVKVKTEEDNRETEKANEGESAGTENLDKGQE